MSVPVPPLHAILDVEASERVGWRPDDVAAAFLDGGAVLLQVRAKGMPSAALLALCERVVKLAEPHHAQVIVNDRPDIARLSGAAGVHVGQDDLTPQDVRRIVGGEAIVGLSTHSLEQVEQGLNSLASYLAVGPVFVTHTKNTECDAVGPAFVTRAAASVGGRVPIVAIGGITLETAALVWEAGATSVAVIGDLLVGGNPRERVADYNRAAAAHFGG